jgi:hypothetical protein
LTALFKQYQQSVQQFALKKPFFLKKKMVLFSYSFLSIHLFAAVCFSHSCGESAKQQHPPSTSDLFMGRQSRKQWPALGINGPSLFYPRANH